MGAVWGGGRWGPKRCIKMTKLFPNIKPSLIWPVYLSIGCISLIIIETQFVDTSFSLLVLLCPADLIIKITKSKLVHYSGTKKKVQHWVIQRHIRTCNSVIICTLYTQGSWFTFIIHVFGTIIEQRNTQDMVSSFTDSGLPWNLAY